MPRKRAANACAKKRPAASPAVATSKAGRKPGVRKTKKTLREEAIAKGIVPKARRPFAMFTQDMLKAPEFQGQPFPACMRRIASEWHALGKTSKQDYKDRCAKEFQKQRALVVELGVARTRLGVSFGGATRIGSSEGPSEQSNGGVTPTPTVTFGRYDVISADTARLGRGSYGKVVQAREKNTGRRVAIKLFEDGGGEEAKLEVAVYERLRARAGDDGLDCFCRLISASCEPPAPWMALTYVPSQNLSTVLKQGLADESKPDVVHQVAHAIETLHRCNMIHLDIKPSNILWSYAEHRAYLIDFGMTLETDDRGACVETSPPAMAVTAPYRCPELWLRCDASTISRAVDVWSFGCVMVEVFSGEPLMGKGKQNWRSSVQQWCTAWNSNDVRLWPCRELVCLPGHWRNVVWWCCAPQAHLRPDVKRDVAAMASMLPPIPTGRTRW